MNARRPKLYFGVAVLLAVLSLWFFFERAQPRYKDKRISAWFDEFYTRHRTNFIANVVFVGGHYERPARISRDIQVFREIGPPAVPFLTDCVLSGLRFDSIYNRFYNSVSSTVQSLLPSPKERATRRLYALTLLAAMGPERCVAAPSFIEAIIRAREGAASLLITVLPELRPSTPDLDRLIGALLEQGRYPEIKAVIEFCRPETLMTGQALGIILEREQGTNEATFLALRDLKEHALLAVPALLRSALSMNREVRYQSIRTIETVGLRTPETMGALQNALADSDPMVRSAAPNALQALRSGAEAPVQQKSQGVDLADDQRVKSPHR